MLSQFISLIAGACSNLCLSCAYSYFINFMFVSYNLCPGAAGPRCSSTDKFNETQKSYYSHLNQSIDLFNKSKNYSTS